MMPKHLIEAIKRGEAASWRGRVWTAKDLTELEDMGALSEPPVASEEGGQVERAALQARIDALEGEVELLRSQSPPPQDGAGLASKLAEVEAERDRLRAQAERVPALEAEAGDLRTRFAAAEAETSRLRQRVADADTEVARLHAEAASKGPDPAVKDLIAGIVPTTRSGLERMTFEQLAAIARFRGLDVAGVGKVELVGLLAKEG